MTTDASTRRRLLAVDALTLAGMFTAVVYHRAAAQVPDQAHIVFTLLAWLPLLGRARWPLPVLGAVLTVECVHLAVLGPPAEGITTAAAMGFYQPVPLASMVAAFSVAYRTPRWAGWLASGAGALLLLLVSLAAQPLSLVATDLVVFNLVAGAAVVGRALAGRRDRRVRADAERRAETHRHVVAERLRIARDLHDSLAHNLTLVNAQIGVADHLVRTDPVAAARALRDINQHTRQALDELRATVGLLRQDDGPATSTDDGPTDPVPGLHRLGALLDGFRTAGTEVELVVTGGAVPTVAQVDVAAYRIVQESLTNATKHAQGTRVLVTLDWSPTRLAVRVVNGPPAGRHRQPVGAPTGTGHGLIGLRERAHQVGGVLLAAATADGGFEVTATLPIGAGAGAGGGGECG